MRPVADNAAVAEAIADLEVNSENIDAFLGILVHEGWISLAVFDFRQSIEERVPP